MRLNIKPVLINSLLLAIFILGCSKQKSIEIGKITIDKDTTWNGIVNITGDVYVPPGVILTIAPGTTIKFSRIDADSPQNLFIPDSPYYPEAELIIRGKLIAKGTKKKPIVFTSAERDARAKDWGAINFLGSDGNIIEYAKIFCAYNGIHAHGSSLTVRHSEFARNGVGISFKKEEETNDAPWFGREPDVTITDSIFTRNKGGIGYRNAKAEIVRNEIIDNKFFGIWPKENSPSNIKNNDITGNKKGVYLYQAKGVKIEQNNIFDNLDYAIAVAEAQDFPIVAEYNWFGTTDEEKIAEIIFDKNDDAELAEIQYKPFLESRVKWEVQP